MQFHLSNHYSLFQMGNSRSKKAPLEPISLEPVSLATHHKGNITGGEGDGPSDYSFPYRYNCLFCHPDLMDNNASNSTINFSNADGEVIKRRRSCTDVPCLLIFGAFLAAWTGIAVIAISNGDIHKWVLGTIFNYINSICIASHILDQTDELQSSAPEKSVGHLVDFLGLC